MRAHEPARALLPASLGARDGRCRVMAQAAVACRQCANEALDDLGRLPEATVFAGQSLDPAWDGGSLYRCRRCELVFRHPVRSEAEYEQLYRQASGSVWVANPLRHDEHLVLDAIRSVCPAGKVLDVGCYDGRLLAALGADYERCGVEASAAAAERARERGVRIVAPRIGDIAALNERFDVVSAVDVIEHTIRPDEFLALLAGVLKPSGSLIVSTGSADAPAWREATAHYWYCSFPEHLSFVSPAWAERTAARLGLRVVAAHRFAYEAIEAGERDAERAKFERRLARTRRADRLSSLLPEAWSAGRRVKVLGRPGLFDDHVVLTLRH